MANPHRTLRIGPTRVDEAGKEVPSMPTIAQLEERQQGHEKICALRYEMICARLRRIERILLWFAASAITGMAGLIITVLIKM